jgi:hypothetical protein
MSGLWEERGPFSGKVFSRCAVWLRPRSKRFCHSTGPFGPVAKNDHFRRSGSPLGRPGGHFWQKTGVFGPGGLIPREMVSIPEEMVGLLHQMVWTPDGMVWPLRQMVSIPRRMVGLVRPRVGIPRQMVGPLCRMVWIPEEMVALLRPRVLNPDGMVGLLCARVFLPARPGWPLAPGIWPPRCRGTEVLAHGPSLEGRVSRVPYFTGQAMSAELVPPGAPGEA